MKSIKLLQRLKPYISFSYENRLLKKYWFNKLHEKRNERNRKLVKNYTPTLICSNCIGGLLYHWLNLPFNSPFINLFMRPKDFILALENWEEFISGELTEVITEKKYPVGQISTSKGPISIYFMHYKNFEESKEKWDTRKKRINTENMGIIMSNFDSRLYSESEINDILTRFENLPFKHKVFFTDFEAKNFPSSYHLKGLEKIKGKLRQVFYTKKINGERYIDQFDYINFINKLLD